MTRQPTVPIGPHHAGRATLRFMGTAEARLALVVAVLSFGCLVYVDSVTSVVRIWSTDGFSHGYLIPGIALFLLWRERRWITDAEWRPAWGGVVVLVGAVWAWLLAKQTLIQIAEHFAVLGILHGLVISAMGWEVYRRAFFPLAYLALAVPAGIDSVPWLMSITAELASVGLHALGVPALREGMYFMLPGGYFEVAEACSGFRYVFSGGALVLLTAYLEFRSWPRRLLFVALAIPSFVLLNGVRATLVMAIASATDMEYLATDHIWFGWLLFAMLAVALYGVASRYGDAYTTR